MLPTYDSRVQHRQVRALYYKWVGAATIHSPPYLRKSCDMKSGTKILLLGEKTDATCPEKTPSFVKWVWTWKWSVQPKYSQCQFRNWWFTPCWWLLRQFLQSVDRRNMYYGLGTRCTFMALLRSHCFTYRAVYQHGISSTHAMLGCGKLIASITFPMKTWENHHLTPYARTNFKVLVHCRKLLNLGARQSGAQFFWACGYTPAKWMGYI